MMPLESEVECLRSKIEKVMMSLPTEQTPEQHRLYLAGYVDCLQETNKYRQDYRAKQAKHPKSDAQQDNPSHSSEGAIVSQSMALRIGIGDRTAIIPISIEMVPA